MIGLTPFFGWVPIVSAAIIDAWMKPDDNDLSGYDSPRVYDVQQVEGHPGCSPCDVPHGGRYIHRRL